MGTLLDDFVSTAAAYSEARERYEGAQVTFKSLSQQASSDTWMDVRLRVNTRYEDMIAARDAFFAAARAYADGGGVASLPDLAAKFAAYERRISDLEICAAKLINAAVVGPSWVVVGDPSARPSHRKGPGDA